jgi:hypothetical protein
MRALYIFFLDLHPDEFRSEYSKELLWIFDEEAARGASKLNLLFDIVKSFARQWILRRAAWKWAIGIAIGALQVAVALAVVFAANHRH